MPASPPPYAEAIAPGGAARPHDPAVLERLEAAGPAAEWEPLAAGVAQRARALDGWVADAHGPRVGELVVNASRGGGAEDVRVG